MIPLHVPPLRLVLVGVLISCAGSFQQGFLLALLNPTKFVFQKFINDSYEDHYGEFLDDKQFSSLWAVLVACVTLGSMFGALLLPVVAQKVGRRNGIWATTLFSMVFAVLEGVSKYANTWELYLVCRLLLGVSVGIALGLQSLYATEITPKECRGFMNTLAGLGMAFMEPMASILGLKVILGSKNLWPVLHFLQVPLFALPLVLLFRYPKSPKLLYAQGHHDKARESIAYFYGENVDVEQIVKEIEAELKAPRMSVAQAFRHPDVRKAIIVAGVLSFGVGFSGGLTILFYASTLLEKMGLSEDTSTYVNIPITAMVFTSIVVVMFTADKIGRRKLTLFGTFCLIFLNASALILSKLFEHFDSRGYNVSWLGYLFLVNAIFILLAFGCSLAPIALFIAAELAPQNGRAAAQSVAVFVRNLSMFAGGFIFYPFNDAAGGWAFLLFIIPMIFVFTFLYFTMPETKGRTYPEILEAWGKLPGGFCGSARVEPEPVVPELIGGKPVFKISN